MKLHLRAELCQFDKLILVFGNDGFDDGGLEEMGDSIVVSVEDQRLMNQSIDVVEVVEKNEADIFDEIFVRKFVSFVIQFDQTFNQQSEVQFEVVFVFAVQLENILSYFFV